MIRIQNVSHSIDGKAILHNVSADLPNGQVTAIVGASGAGKTTLLRLLSGLDCVQDGSISINGNTVAGRLCHTTPCQRKVGMVFQDIALFPHLTVLKNIMFGQRRKDKTFARSLLQSFDLADKETAKPHQLSGGQQQRVAVARALAANPNALLLDEAFSGLDAQTRPVVRSAVLRVLKEKQTTTVMVTHDVAEAMQCADHMIVMYDGRILQAGSPQQLYQNPQHAYVAQLLHADFNELPLEAYNTLTNTQMTQSVVGAAHKVCFRGKNICMSQNPADPAAVVTDCRCLGMQTRVSLQTNIAGKQHDLQADIQTGSANITTGQRVHFHLDDTAAFVFPAAANIA